LFLAESPRETNNSKDSNSLLFLAESPRETNNSKDSPASQADSGVFSIASSASPSKTDTVLNSDVRSPESPSRSLGDQQHPHQSKQEHNQCEYRRVSVWIRVSD
jgi:hypothetical protein